jgi:hypothetical protein
VRQRSTKVTIPRYRLRTLQVELTFVFFWLPGECRLQNEGQADSGAYNLLLRSEYFN